MFLERTPKSVQSSANVGARPLRRMKARYGQGVVAPAALLDLRRKPAHSRDAPPERYGALLPGETAQRRLAIPRFAAASLGDR